jgi:hypothetical protein
VLRGADLRSSFAPPWAAEPSRHPLSAASHHLSLFLLSARSAAADKRLVGSQSTNRIRACLVLSALAAVLAKPAFAEVELVNKDGWSVATNGRANGFYSYEFGDYEPQGGTPGMGGIVSTPFQAAPDADPKKFSVSRVHSGFVGSILGLQRAQGDLADAEGVCTHGALVAHRDGPVQELLVDDAGSA